MNENMIKVYVKVDENNVIVAINSEIFLDDTTGWICIDEGIGDKYAHAQGHYLENGLMDDQGRNNYILDDGDLKELDEEQKEILFPTPLPQPTFEELQTDFNIDVDFRLSMLELGI